MEIFLGIILIIVCVGTMILPIMELVEEIKLRKASKDSSVSSTKEEMQDQYTIYSVIGEIFRFENYLLFNLHYDANVGCGEISFTYDIKSHEWTVNDKRMDEEFCISVLSRWLHDIY